MAKFSSNASGAVLLQNAVHVTESISGSVVPLAMFYQYLDRGGNVILDDGIDDGLDLLHCLGVKGRGLDPKVLPCPGLSQKPRDRDRVSFSFSLLTNFSFSHSV